MKEVSLRQLYKDIEAPAGSRMGGQKVRTEAKPDPVGALTRPLGHYEGRVFFYCGLLYGFCRLDASITERFREQTGSVLPTVQHVTQEPLVSLPWFPDFAKTNVARLLQSCEAGVEQNNLFDFIACQLVVDRKRQVVWKVKMVPIKIPDPVMLAAKEVPVAADIVAFVPYQHDQGFSITQKPGMIVGTPEVLRVSHTDAAFQQKTKEALSAQ